MAARSKMALAIGSSQWIQNERDQAQQFHDLEVEEFSYAASNELDWLNEHMAEIFSRDQRNFTDVFKTPGKLRGKTPMTARKRDPLAARAPLSDLFAPNPQSTLSPGPNNAFYNKVAQFKVAEDRDEQQQSPNKGASRRSPLRLGKGNADSGYHGTTEDEMDVDSRNHSQSTAAPSFVQTAAAEPALQTLDELAQPETRQDDSSVSATEDVERTNADTQETDTTIADEDLHADEDEEEQEKDVQYAASSAHAADNEHGPSTNWQADQDEYDEDQAEAVEEEDDEEANAKSPSDTSSPDKPVLRKSSLNFAALPAREPLKRSIGARSSHIDTYGRGSALGRQTHGKSLGASQHPAEQAAGHEEESDDENVVDENENVVDENENVVDENEAVQKHNKTSTQTLHERISALGQSKEPRPSKSIPSLANSSAYPVLPRDAETLQRDSQPATDDDDDDEDDDDWIAPIKTTSRQASGADMSLDQKPESPRPSFTDSFDDGPPPVPTLVARNSPYKHLLTHQKSISTITLTSPGKYSVAPDSYHKKALSISNPNLSHAIVQGQATPTSSPSGKRFADAPLSASKARLYSVLKSAKGIFASSASAGAHSKPNSIASPSRQNLAASSDDEFDMSRMPGGFVFPMAPEPSERPADGRKTRSSTESDKRKERDNKAADELERARQKEREKAAEHKDKIDRAKAARPTTANRADSQKSAFEDQSEAEDMPPPAPPKTLLPPGKLRAPTGRLVRPTRPQTAPSRPAPMNIKVTSQSQRMGPAQPPDRSLEPTPPPMTRPRPPTRTGSARPESKNGLNSTARVRALEAAARKKEQDEKAAQRKADQKKELERKRAAKVEEERRAEEERKAAESKRVREEKLAEQRRIQEARVAAQRQAEQRRLDEQRLQAAQEKARVEQLTAAIEQEKQDKLRAQNYPRGDVQGTLRQLAQKEISRPAVPAKSIKRSADTEDDPQQRPGLQRGPASYQQQDNKRRKTLEEDEVAHERHSVMAPPKRPSNMRKNTQDTLGKFPNGYTHAPPPAAHHTQGMNMYKATVTSQHQLQHAKAPMHPNDMLKLSTARIPFAESASQSSQSSQSYAESSKPSAFKTPGRPASAMPKSVKSAKSAAKSSPLYVNGENIALPEIQTDSEDESDSDDDGPGPSNGGFRAPSWVASPALRDLLTQQQLVDPESVFGPIAPLQMDEVFKGSKGDRMKRFRDRGSSARWVETGDAVTQEEKKRDQELRGKLFKDGGWTYSQQL